MVRKQTLETQVGTMAGAGNSAGPSISGTFFRNDGHDEGIPFYPCLGDPSAASGHLPSQTSKAYPALPQLSDQNFQNSVDLMYPEGIPNTDSETDTDEEYWEKECREDPYPAESLQQGRDEAKTNPTYLAELWWAQRKAISRFRAAEGPASDPR